MHGESFKIAEIAPLWPFRAILMLRPASGQLLDFALAVTGPHEAVNAAWEHATNLAEETATFLKDYGGKRRTHINVT